MYGNLPRVTLRELHVGSEEATAAPSPSAGSPQQNSRKSAIRSSVEAQLRVVAVAIAVVPGVVVVVVIPSSRIAQRGVVVDVHAL